MNKKGPEGRAGMSGIPLRRQLWRRVGVGQMCGDVGCGFSETESSCFFLSP